MRVLFTHSYFLQLDPKQLKSAKPYPPLALLYAAAQLREQGHEVFVADLQFASSPQEIEKHILQNNPEVLVVYDDSFNYLTKMCLTNMREAVFEMMKIASFYKLPVIVSSSDATDHLEKYFLNGSSYVIIGEAEITLSELVKALEEKNTEGIQHIMGLSYKEHGQIKKTAKRQVMRDLDQLPSPAWDLIDMTSYREMWLNNHGYFSINMVTTRGCPYKCNWCAKPVYGNRYNSHSAGRIVQEISDLKESLGITHIWFADDIFGLKPGFIEQFNTEIQKRGLKIKYKIQSRADLLLDPALVAQLASSGCQEVWIGAESGSQKVLDAMDKGITVENITVATNNLRAADIKPCFFLQFGYSGENAADIMLTIQMLENLRPADIGVSVSYPLPGTVFYEKVKHDLVKKQNWKDSDDLEIMFEGTYSAKFYKLLQRYVHYGFRSSQAFAMLNGNFFKREVALLPYYYLRKRKFKRLMQTEAPEVTALLN